MLEWVEVIKKECSISIKWVHECVDGATSHFLVHAIFMTLALPARKNQIYPHLPPYLPI
jgi:hypothetical protein